MIVDAAYESVQDRCNCDAAFDVRHIRTTVKRMARAVQFIRHVKWRSVSFAGREIVSDDFQMSGSFLRENIVKHRIHFQRGLFLKRFLAGRCCNSNYRGIRVAISEGVRTRNIQADFGCRRSAYLQLLYQLRHRS